MLGNARWHQSERERERECGERDNAERTGGDRTRRREGERERESKVI